MFGFLKRQKFAPADAGKTPLSLARFTVVDTELTGLDEKKDAILSIGAVRMIGGTIRMGETFYRLVNPSRELPAASVVIHEITPSEVAAQPGIDTVIREYLDFIGDDVVVGHFPAIDLAFLGRDAKRYLNRDLVNPVIDTCSVYLWLRKRLPQVAWFSGHCPDYRLADIARSMGIPVEGAHNALQDAFITAQLFQRFLSLLGEAGVHDVGDLAWIGGPFSGDVRGGHQEPLSNL